jgi:hypothetical protein
MRTSLKALLDKARGAREVLPHLAALEAALGQHGLAAIDSASTPALQKMYSQLSSLPIATDDRPLHELLARLMVALEDRALEAKVHAPVVKAASGFGSDSKLMVSEGTHSQFMAAFGDRDDDPAPPAQGRSHAG